MSLSPISEFPLTNSWEEAASNPSLPRIYSTSDLPIAISRYLQNTYPTARQILLGGSYAKGVANIESDFDIIVLHDRVTSVCRKALEVEGRVLDIAVHDYESLLAFMKLEVQSAVCGLADDVANAVFLMPATSKCHEILNYARKLLADGPPAFDAGDFKAHLLGQISDLRAAGNSETAFALAVNIASKLMLFAARASGGWIGNGKYLVEDLRHFNSSLIEDLTGAVGEIVVNRNCLRLVELTEKVLIYYTGNKDVAWERFYKLGR